MSAFINASTESTLRPMDGAASDYATRNIATTAGLAVAAGTCVAGAAILTAALPGQMILAASTTGVLLYVGDRQHNDLPIIPSRDNAAPAAVTPVADTTPVAESAAV